MQDNPKLREILDEAAELPPSRRTAFLDAACGGDDGLRAEIESLLLALDQTSEFLAAPTMAPPTVQNPTDELGSRIGPYKLVKRLGEGGMGVVYLAGQEQPVRRNVALKIIKLGMDSAAIIARFEAERQALALMDHSGIARVYDAGKAANGRPYFVMELVQGVPVTQYCDENRLPPTERLALFIPICQAVQHAHQKGIIHRDLKPGNILVAVQDGKPIAKVIDFGIAKALHNSLTETAVFTQMGMLVGTPEYMSPEQVGGGSEEMDTRSDIYALGVILYELLTGTTPLNKVQLLQAGFEGMIRTIREVEPVRPSTRYLAAGDAAATASALRRMDPRKLAKLLAGDLDLIIMKCLEKSRSRRYESASALARDIERFLNHDPVEATPPSTLYVLNKLAWKHRRPLSAIIAFVLLFMAFLAATSGVFWFLKAEAVGQRDIAVKAKSAAEAARLSETAAKDEAVKQKQFAEERRMAAELGVAKGLSNLAAAGRTSRDRKQAYVESRNAFARLGYPTAYADWGLAGEWKYSPEAVATLSANSAAIRCISLQRHSFVAVSGGDDGVVRTWNLFIGRPIRSFTGHQGIVRTVAFSPDGSRIVSGGDDGTLRIWDSQAGQCLRIVDGHQGPIHSAAFLPDGKSVLVAGEMGSVQLRNIDDGTLIRTFAGHQGIVRCVAISPDGNSAATCGDDESVKLWNLTTGDLLRTWESGAGSGGGGSTTTSGKGPKFTVAFSPTGDRIATSGTGAWIVLLDVKTGTSRFLAGAMHPTGVTSVAFSPFGRDLVSAGDQNICLWDSTLPTDSPWLRIFTDHSSETTAAAFLDNGRLVLSSSLDGTLRLWNQGFEFGVPLGERRKTNGTLGIGISPDSQMAVTAGNSLEVFDLATHRLLQTFSGNSGWVGASFLPDGHRILAASNHDGTSELNFCDIATGTGTTENVAAGHSARICGLAVSSDGNFAATPSEDNTVRLWNVQSRTFVRALRGHDLPVRAAVFSPDCRSVFTVSDDKTARLWEVRSGNQLRKFTGHSGPVNCAAFSPDGRRAVTGSDDRLVKVWDVESGQERLTLKGAPFSVRSVAYSPDGKLIVAGSRFYQYMTVWDAENGRLLRSMTTHGAGSLSLAASMDGNWLVAGSENEPPAAWDVGRPRRLFTLAERMQQASRGAAINPNDASVLALHGEWYAVCDQFDWAADALTQAEHSGANVSALLLARCWWRSSEQSADPLALLKNAERAYGRAIERKEAPEFYLKLCIEAVRGEEQSVAALHGDGAARPATPTTEP